MSPPILNRDHALVIFSGGLDSTVALYWARQRYETVRAIAFDYGQRHGLELKCAAKVAKRAGLGLEIAKIPTIIESELTMPEKPLEDTIGGGIGGQSTVFVPGRNLVFLAYSAQIAANSGIGAVIGGFGGHDTEGPTYPDQRLDALLAMGEALNLGIYGRRDATEYRFPFAGMTKTQVLLEAHIMPDCWASLAFTHTCYRGVYPPCGVCTACKLRSDAFFLFGYPDPLTQRGKRRRKPGKKGRMVHIPVTDSVGVGRG